MPITTEPKGSKPSLPGLIKIDLGFQVNPGWTTAAHLILHARFSDNVNHSLSDLTNVGSNVPTHFTTRIKPFWGSSCTWTSVAVSSLGGDGLLYQGTGSVPGTGSTPIYPPQVSVCISWKAAIAWRGGRPRTYLPGIPQAATTSVGSPALASSYSGALAAAATSLLSDIQGDSYSSATLSLGVPSYYSKGAFRSPPLFLPFQGAVVHDRLSSQRRRSAKERGYGID
jgi:hypothetical protein